MPRKKEEVASTENQLTGFTDQVLQEWISFPRVTVTDETDDAYIVEFDGMKHEVAKRNTEEVKGGAYMGGAGCRAMDTRNELRQVLVPASGIFLERNIPSEFREVVAFHELRHVEYECDDDSHQKALHDEILYIIKYFSAELRERYLKFAKRLRENLSPLEEGKRNGDVIRAGSKFYATFECLKEMFPSRDDLLSDTVQRVPYYQRNGQVFYRVDTVEQLILAPEIRKKYLEFMKERRRSKQSRLEELEREGSIIKVSGKKYATSGCLCGIFDAGYRLVLSAGSGAKSVQRGRDVFYDVEYVEKVFLESDDLPFVAHRAKLALPRVDHMRALRVNSREYMYCDERAFAGRSPVVKIGDGDNRYVFVDQTSVLRTNGNEYMLPQDLATSFNVSKTLIYKVVRDNKLQSVSGRNSSGEVRTGFYNVEEVRKILSESDVFQAPHADKDGVIMREGRRYSTNSRLANILSKVKLPTDITQTYKMICHAEKRAGLKPIKGSLHGHLKEFYDEDAVRAALENPQNI